MTKAGGFQDDLSDLGWQNSARNIRSVPAGCKVSVLPRRATLPLGEGFKRIIPQRLAEADAGAHTDRLPT